MSGNRRQGRSPSRIHRLSYLLSDRKCFPMNPNKALWEKGDFTRIAATMRETGEATYNFARGTRARVMALFRRSSRLPGMPDAFDRAPLR